MHIVNERQKQLLLWFMHEVGVAGDPTTVTSREVVEAALKLADREGMDKLIRYLASTDYYTAPASTRFHGNYEGALAQHSIHVAALLLKKNRELALGLPDGSCMLAGLCHDLCKVNFYVPDYKNKKVYSEHGSKSDVKGRFDWEMVPSYTIEDKFPCGHGEKSVIMLQNFMKLTQDEILLIRWHMGPFAAANEYDFNSALDFRSEIVAIFTADMEAAALFEEKR